MHWLNTYLKTIASIRQTGTDTELSYRTAIHNMLHAAAGNTDTAALKILHEPQRQQGNAPDFRITDDFDAIIGYVECKRPGANLSALIKSDQINRYVGLSPNIILTDGWRWILIREGKTTAEVTLSTTIDNQTKDRFSQLLATFFNAQAEQIGDAKRLAKALAVRCQILQADLCDNIADDNSKLRGLFDAFKKFIYHDMQAAQFADAFAQTTVYSLLMARLQAGVGEKLDLFSVQKYIPQTFSLIRELSGFLVELERQEYRGLAWIVNDILTIVNNMDVAAVVETMSDTQKTGMVDSDDPFFYFYENFLAAYDPALRKARGVYYTPLPVVRFIVRAVDDTLRNHFGIRTGLADETVTALDFATGTGTFLLQMMRLALNGKSEAECRQLTKGHLLKNYYGFEFLIAPYTIAHLKLSRFLADKKCGLDEHKSEKQLNIFLTNTLEGISNQIPMPLLPALTEEARLAGEIKKNPILVIMGNPPYSGYSQNNSDFIKQLVRDYYYVDGAPLGERNPKWLQDDYVKFIRFAQHKMQESDRGMVAIITNHGFLDNPTFRGMRQSLITTFDHLYFLDMHGNTRKKETVPDGGKDENVFDIQQGTCISLMIKNSDLTKGVFHYDVFGRRDTKYNFCEANTIQSVKWKKLKPTSPFYLFIPQTKKLVNQYQTYPSLTDIFNISGAGITTAHDDFVIDFEAKELINRFTRFINSDRNAKILHSDFNVNHKKGWDILRGYDALQDNAQLEQRVKSIHYRPFDNRYIFYEDHLVWRTVKKIMQHMLAGDNLALITHKREELQVDWSHAMVTKNITEHGSLSSKTTNYLFPLYFYDGNANGNTQKIENIKPAFRRWIDKHYGEQLSPESIMGYIYAVLHFPDYRRRYAELLRMDFPRIPFTEDIKTFRHLAKIGGRLITAHLLKDDQLTSPLRLHGRSLIVEKVRYIEDSKKLFINKETYFAPLPPEVFNFPIGGYLPLDKYLKSRKNRELTLNDTSIIKKATAAIRFTIQQMSGIAQSNLKL